MGGTQVAGKLETLVDRPSACTVSADNWVDEQDAELRGVLVVTMALADIFGLSLPGVSAADPGPAVGGGRRLGDRAGRALAPSHYTTSKFDTPYPLCGPVKVGESIMLCVTSDVGSLRRVPAPTLDRRQIHSLNRPNMVSVGTIVWLSSELMFFAALFAMYFSHRAASPDLWAEETEKLALPYALTFTIILVASSITCQLGVFDAEKGNAAGLRRWFMISFIMGLVFVLGQANEYRNLVVHEGLSISSNGYGSMFYLTTGFHGLHVIGGLIAFIFIMIRSTMGRFTPAQATSAIVVSYYWHFVDIVWIGLFATIYLIK